VLKHLQQSRISKFSGRGPPGPQLQGEGRKGKGGGEGGKGKERREGKDREGREGREGTGEGRRGGMGWGGEGRGRALGMGSAPWRQALDPPLFRDPHNDVVDSRKWRRKEVRVRGPIVVQICRKIWGLGSVRSRTVRKCVSFCEH